MTYTQLHAIVYLYIMLEAIFKEGSEILDRYLAADEQGKLAIRDEALLRRAIELALESAFTYGIDLPVGAVVASGREIVGRWFARDVANRHRFAHAEFMAIGDWQMGKIAVGSPSPDTLVTTIEPCVRCQDAIARVPSIKRVGFGITRSEVAERGLVTPHDETIFERTKRLGLPYEVVLIDDPMTTAVGGIILDHVSRDREIGAVEVDRDGLVEAIRSLADVDTEPI